jgi:hypothetical protein
LSLDTATLAANAIPPIAAAVRVYGVGVLERLQDAATDSTVGVGGRLLQRFLSRGQVPAIEAAVVELADDTADSDRLATLRLQVRKALAADSELAEAVARELGTTEVSIVASGDRAVAAQYMHGTIVTGDNATITR